ncbi:methyl-accepting chemotaxis protein [Methylobacterium oryzisoli]|uniref:methyl-accepting chemotaxis protein n=1 Tax=Methylobacterium oryzisoli TaxID=3385502 RepID=UPI00389252DF
MMFTNGRAVLEAIDRSQGRIEFDLDGTIRFANRLFLELIGYRLEEIVGQHHSMLVPQAERDGAGYRELWEQLRRGQFQAREFKRIGKNGRVIWIEASYNPVLDRSGRPVKVVKLATDITARKARDAAFEGQISALNRTQAVIRFTLDGTVTDANENFLSAMGYGLDEVRGRHHSLFVSEAERASPAYATFWKSLAEGRHQAGEFRRVGKGGREIWIFGAYNPVLDSDGRPCAVVKFASDVTQQVQDRLRRAEGQRSIEADIEAITHAMGAVAQQAGATTQTAVETSHNVQAVAAGAEEFASSIDELSQHATRAKTAADAAVERAQAANVIISGLTRATDRIGEAVTLIRMIANQTNLLALNATIEAARAGEAGRGFAVVAAEVKALAGQSSRATEEIGQQINAVQDATAQAVAAIDVISRSISDLSEISLSVSSAVTEQAAVTREMSLNMQNAADSVATVRQTMETITQATQEVDASVRKVAVAARNLA